MPKFTLDNSFRFYSQKETTPNFHSESIERLLQKLSSADWLPLYAREGLIQADLMRWKEMLVKINDVLDGAMKKQATNQSVNMWLAKVQNLAYDVEDLLDEFQTETFRRELLMPGESTSQPSTSQQPNSRPRTIPLYARESLIQADLMGWKEMLVKINDDVLDDSMKKQATNQSVNMWLAKLQNLVYYVEDLSDEFQKETFWRELMPGESTSQPSTSQQPNSRAMSRVKEVTARLQRISWEIAPLGLKSRNVRRGLVPTSSLILAAVRLRGGRRDPIPGPTIFSPLVNLANLAFLKNEEKLDFLEKIGLGSLGQVYKTELPGSNGKMIAIKKIVQPPKKWQMGQIRSEITIASQIRHMNILPSLAHLARPDCHLLVYEFMKNGSLQDILNDVSQGRRELDWPVRHRIALGIASGLEYLHFNHRLTIMHGDIKPANVFLDDDMTAKIADFEIAMAMPDPQTHIQTERIVGTMGYMAPEYAIWGKAHCKCDIYSFGVLLAVLVIGKRPSDEFFHLKEEMEWVRWMRNIVTSENPIRDGYEEQMFLVLKIARLCTKEDSQERPTSTDVKYMLSQIQH